jgi:excisionase family DNA binding protein
MQDRLLRKDEARQTLEVSAPTFDRIVARGDLPVVRLSARVIRISATALRRYIEERTQRRGQ